jgi:hypothetical protein
MNESYDCRTCSAFGQFCEGNANDAIGCNELRCWVEAIGGLDLDIPLAPQPRFELPRFLPQILNGLEIPSMLAREPVVVVGIAKALTPRGQVSRRALPLPYGPHDMRAQWGIGEDTRLLCIGNYLDGYLEKLWRAQARENVWGRLRSLGFDAATSLNFSIYLDRPRLEHLVNIKRSWLTVKRMQEMSRLIPIPHLQWATTLDLECQLDYARAQGFHTLTMNLQMFKRQGWETVAAGLPLIRERAPELRILVTGIASLKRMAELVEALPHVSFTNTTAHYLAQRCVRLQRDGTRLIKEPVDGHPDLILAENIRLYREFLAELDGDDEFQPRIPFPSEQALIAASREVAARLQDRFGFDPQATSDAFDLLATDKTILEAFQEWLHNGEVDRQFRGSFPTWPCSDCVPHPTLGELLDQGADPLDAYLHLARLANQVHEEIQASASRAGY